MFKHYKLKPSFPIIKDNKAKDRAGWVLADQLILIWSNFYFFIQLNIEKSIRTDLNQFYLIWSYMIQFCLFWSNFVSFDPILSLLIPFYLFWSNIVSFDPIRSDLNWFVPIRSGLIQFYPILSNLVQFSQSNLIKFTMIWF